MPDFSTMNSTGFRRLVSERFEISAIGQSGGQSGDHLLNPDFKERIVNENAKKAAVLIPIIERAGGLTVLFTKRADKLKNHSGQVAFPGGRIDDSDASPEAAALREANEEIGLVTGKAQIIGRMAEYFTGSGYSIVPVVALVSADVELVPNPQEVDYMFEVPLAFLMDETNHQKASRILQGKERFYLEMPYGEHHIWGVTAGIVRLLHDRLRGL